MGRRKETEDVRKKDLVGWYIEETLGSEIESQEEVIEKKLIVEKVLDRLAYQDNVLVPLSKTGLKTDQDASADENPILIVHPNYVEDELNVFLYDTKLILFFFLPLVT